jgi:hypothetical protein
LSDWHDFFHCGSLDVLSSAIESAEKTNDNATNAKVQKKYVFNKLIINLALSIKYKKYLFKHYMLYNGFIYINL